MKNKAPRPQGLLKRLAGPTLISASVAASPAALALDWQTGPVHFEQLQRSSRPLIVNPRSLGLRLQPHSLSLLGQGQLSFDEAIHALLRDELANPLIASKSVDTTPQGAGLAAAVGGQSRDYTFFVGGVPLCDLQLRAHQLPDGSAFVLGTLPEIDAYETAPSDWPDMDLSAEQGARSLQASTLQRDVRLVSSSRCVYIGGGKLFPVWQMVMYAGGNPYKLLADAYATLKMDQMFFDVNGTAMAVARNINDTAQSVTLSDLSGDGTLTNTYLKTVVPSAYTQALQSSETFNYSQSDQQFSEVQAFVHANTHLTWFEGLGFQWYGPKPLQLMIHKAPNNVANNALFTPGTDSGTPPSIQIDNGDGAVLQNLVTDGDVVSHEFGHHVIYKTLTTTSGESLVLHEGLADTFVFLRTGDPNLGRTICPAASSACQKQGQALRTGLLTVAYNDSTWVGWSGPANVLGHHHGQLISGIIWDLVKNNAMNIKDVTNLTFKTISFFKGDSGLCDFASSLLAADQALFHGANQSAISGILKARGMSQFLPTATPACTTLSGGAGVTQDSGDSGSSGGKGKWLKCGTVDVGGRAGAWALLAVLALPVVLALRDVPALARVRRPSPRRRK